MTVQKQRNGICVLSYGGPEELLEVEPFLTRVLSGKSISEARRRVVLERYRQVNGVSPLNAQCRIFLKELSNCFEEAENDSNRPAIFWGNLFAPPLIEETVKKIVEADLDRLYVFATSPLDGPVGSDRYYQRFRQAIEAIEGRHPLCHFAEPFELNSDYLRACSDSFLSAAAILELDSFNRSKREVLTVFSAHSLPEKTATISNYRSRLEQHCAEIVQLVHSDFPYRLAFQSQSGPPSIPWLGPNIIDVVRQYKTEHPVWQDLLVVPIGFFFENMETVYDLDIELRSVCSDLKIEYYRAQCPGTDPRSAKMTAKAAQKFFEVSRK